MIEEERIRGGRMENFLDLLFPAKCPLCDVLLKREETGMCGRCRQRLPVVTEPCCKHCGKPIPGYTEEFCPDCSGGRSTLEQGTALWVYTDRMKKAMADFKYQGCLSDGEFYGREFMAMREGLLRQWKPSVIIPVPLHWRRRWFRGFNQAAYVAEVIGRKSGIPVLPDALLRNRYTRPQKSLDDKQRKENLKDVFSVNPVWREKISAYHRVLMIDDIYTTGATLEACGAVLRDAGVKKVYFACLCIGSAC